MGTIRTSDANLRDLLDRVRAGEEILLTEDGLPLAKISPVPHRRDPEEVRRTLHRWDELTRSWSLRGAKLKDLIEEGRS